MSLFNMRLLNDGLGSFLSSVREAKEGTVNYLLRILYTGAGPEGRARLHRDTIPETREGLEYLLDVDPSAFIEAVPQHIDKQTRFFSKDYFENTLIERRIAQAQEKSVPLSYVVMDIDNFSIFNNKYGHDFGDKVIEELCNAIRGRFRTHERRKVKAPFFDSRTRERRESFKPDLVARIDDYTATGRIGRGDEFAIILYGIGQEKARLIMDRFRHAINELRISYGGIEAGIGISVGIAEYAQGIGTRELRKRADMALYKAKELGKNNVQVYTQDFEKPVTPPNLSN